MSLILLIVAVCVMLVAGSMPGSDIQSLSSYTLLKTGKFGSQLYSVDAPNSDYASYPVKLLDLHGPTSFSQGFDAGALLGNEFVDSYDSLLKALLGDEWWEPAAAALVGKVLDWQWDDYLSKQVPEEYIEELKGLTAGGFSIGIKHEVGRLASRGIVLANLPSTLTNFKYVLLDEKNHPPTSSNSTSFTFDETMNLLKKWEQHWAGFTCSMFGVWGSRTEAGKLFTGRNLDWVKDTGISKNKLITIHHPPLNKGYAHATIGWSGLWGAITGISSQGLTVHEANLESNDITFRGFPWVLRLRYVMANAKNIDEALSIWQSTNSTVGFNHGIGSASDGKAVLMETMMGNSAIFGANDIRESDYVYNGIQIGSPREEAVYRTNHGYDTYTIEHYMWNNTGAMDDSIERYLAFPEAFDSYAASKTSISFVEAVNITAILGSKGDNKYVCESPYTHGSNVLSVAYEPASKFAYAAWEHGTGDADWRPAACSTYLKIDFRRWF